MHLLRTELHALDETALAVDLGQTRADLVVLSFADSDLSVLAKAWETLAPQAGGASLRLASLAALRHPYSVDLYLESVIAHARVVLVRLLGGLDYWRYGVEEIARLARERAGVHPRRRLRRPAPRRRLDAPGPRARPSFRLLPQRRRGERRGRAAPSAARDRP
jgi:cobalamin biosynthesis Mg chelatase CobN